jgi:putative heme-binding domain-containing protein
VPELLRAYRDPLTRSEAVAALVGVPDLRALDAYLDGLTARSPGLRDDCRTAMAAIRQPAWPLIREKLAAGTLPASVALELKSLYRDDPSIAPLFESARQRVTAVDYSTFALSHAGDPARGKAVFTDPMGTGCAKCHRVSGEGGVGGPDLSHIASNYGRAELIESILSPSKKVADGYRLITVALLDGKIISGVVIENTNETLTLVDNRGEKHVCRMKDIEQKTERASSGMPEDLQSGLTLQEFADLVCYLESLR